MRNNKIIYLVILLAGFLTACGGGESEESNMALIKTTNPTPALIDKSSKKNENQITSIEREVEKFEEIYDVAVVKGKKDTLVAYKVKQLQRFKMKNIEKKVTTMLEKKFPKEQFTVSSDYKIFLEAVRLREKIDKPGFTDKQAEEKLQKIITLQKELT